MAQAHAPNTVPENVPENVPLWAHAPDCLGCGPENPSGLQIEVVRVGNEVITELTFDERHIGGPGLAHGGAVATACDDLFGFVLYLVSEAAVTRSLTVEYHKPVVLGQRYRIAARLNRREGRKLWMSATGTDPDGTLAFTAQALFVVVEVSHFAQYGSVERNPGLAALLRSSNGAGGQHKPVSE